MSERARTLAHELEQANEALEALHTKRDDPVRIVVKP